MSEQRSRSPKPGIEAELATAQTAVPSDAQIQQQITALKNIVEQHQGRLNTVDQRSAHTRDQMQKAQQLEASKQAIVSSWSDSAGPQERMKAIEDMVAKHDSLRGKYTSTTTLRTKSGWSHFSIVEFFTKDARNDFLELVKKDALICQGQIAIARAQIPKYQRETDQPLRCAISVYSQVIGKQQRYKPTWEMSAVWHDGEWILHMQTQEYDKTRVNIYVNEAVMQAFSDKFAAEWAQWGGQKGSGRRADGYRPQDYYTIQVTAMTASIANDLDEKYTALQEQKRYAKWDFNGATKETIASMNKDIEDGIANENLKEGRPTDIWHKLSSAYLQAIERNIPKISSRPRKPWITQSTLDLLEERGRLRQQGDMTKVAELNRDIRKAAKRDKRNWLDGQLQTGDWGPITNLRKPFRTQVLALRRNDQTTHTATNADIYASHLANEQWKEAGMPEGLSDTPVLNAPPTISESTISMEERLQDLVDAKKHQELVSNPLFEVIMGEDISACKHQRSGIRQGCTLSPLLFILLQTVLFHDVQQQYLRKHPLANTPRLPFFDVEFADDTVLIARTQEQMQDLLLIVQEE
ncbi:unnamed protein product, partial [Symbiodinium microadriaticum]